MIIQNREKKLWNGTSCDKNAVDAIDCLRGLSASKIFDGCQVDQCISKSVHKSATVGVPETLFNAFLNVSKVNAA